MVNEALAFIHMALAFAYRQGLHECGYDPVAVVEAALSDTMDRALAAECELARLRRDDEERVFAATYPAGGR